MRGADTIVQLACPEDNYLLEQKRCLESEAEAAAVAHMASGSGHTSREASKAKSSSGGAGGDPEDPANDPNKQKNQRKAFNTKPLTADDKKVIYMAALMHYNRGI